MSLCAFPQIPFRSTLLLQLESLHLHEFLHQANLCRYPRTMLAGLHTGCQALR